jgi:HPt (histidine-containing phosphotransfer) domain-containing protein
MSNGEGVVLDESVLHELFGSDSELHGHILSEFEDSLSGYCSEFESAWRAQSAEAMKGVAHKLKSSALTVGAVQLAGVCDQLEMAGKGQAWTQVELIYPQLQPAVDAVCQYISMR